MMLAQVAAVVWSATCGTITPSGLYTAPFNQAGPCTVTASATGRNGTKGAPSTVRLLTFERDPGLALGMSQWPEDSYCGGMMTAAMQPLAPKDVLARVQLAARCGVRLIIVPPRKFLTATGQVNGLFVPDSARRVTDAYAAVLPPDTLSKYRSTLLGFNLGDDYGDKTAWGGVAITPTDIGAWAVYARAKLPGLPLGVRVPPPWVTTTLAPLLDYAWAQYRTDFGDQVTYYNTAAARANLLGLKLVMGVNLGNCSGPNTSPCTPAQIALVGNAVAHGGACAVVSWAYDPEQWVKLDYRAAWAVVAAQAATVPARECRRGA